VGSNQCWPDIDFFQYPPGRILEFLKFLLTHRVSKIRIFYKIETHLVSTCIESIQVSIYIFGQKNRLVCIRAWFCKNLLRFYVSMPVIKHTL
jgi:hypothetical protein